MSGTVTVRVSESEEFVDALGGVEEFCRRMVGQVCEAPQVSAKAGEDLYAAVEPVPDGQDLERLTRDVYVTVRLLDAGEVAIAGAP